MQLYKISQFSNDIKRLFIFHVLCTYCVSTFTFHIPPLIVLRKFFIYHVLSPSKSLLHAFPVLYNLVIIAPYLFKTQAPYVNLGLLELTIVGSTPKWIAPLKSAGLTPWGIITYSLSEKASFISFWSMVDLANQPTRKTNKYDIPSVLQFCVQDHYGTRFPPLFSVILS